MSSSSENARERELNRFRSLFPNPDQDFAASTDRSITAFAQLGALRLEAKRCIISLVGKDTEYVLADAGWPAHRERRGETDEVYTSRSADCRGVGHLLIDLVNGARQIPDTIVVADVQQNERFKPLHAPATEICFLAAKPLKTYSGHIIGFLYIVDDGPRVGLDEDEQETLQDIVIPVMDYLEVASTKVRHHRAERMIKALGLYLEGATSLREWWMTQGKSGQSVLQSQMNNDSRRGKNYEQQADGEFGVQEGPDKVSPANKIDMDQFSTINRPIPVRTDSSTATRTVSQGTSEQEDDTARTTNTQSGPSVSSGLPSNAFPSKSFGDEEEAPVGLSTDVKQSFGRACNLIREAMDVEGAIFFDASIGSFGSASLNSNMNEKAPGAHVVKRDETTTTTSGSESGSQQYSADQADDQELSDSAQILGFSTRSRSSLSAHSSTNDQQSFPVPLLRRLAKKYPHGKVFYFDASGAMSGSESDPAKRVSNSDKPEKEFRKKKGRVSRHLDAAGIQAVVPGARSVAWFPLWDFHLERWYAGGLVWSTSPTRCLSGDEDLTYMATFGNSIMSEVYRLSALAASRIKADFISSISHELRSPLHGILANVEFLEEQEMTSSQAEMIHTIHACGTTLVQTIDHLLDFREIDRKVKMAKGAWSKQRTNSRHRRTSNSRGRRGAHPTLDVVNIRTLTEEIVDSVSAGHPSRDQRSLLLNSTNGATPQQSDLSPLYIILDFAQHNWLYKTDGGAIRRILMNLFSNALKYTVSGFVRIKMSVQRDWLEMEVSDSGIGISQEFLRNHAFTAFKQENYLAAGTGLGLSIVRSLVLDLGGKINITSELTSGTTAVASIPLSHCSADNEIIDESSSLRGVKVCIVNSSFDMLPDMSEEPTGILSGKARGLFMLKSSLTTTLTDWANMEVTTSLNMDLDSATVHVVMLSENIEDDIREAALRKSKESPCVVLVVCEYGWRGVSRKVQGVQISYLNQPVCPGRLIRVLLGALQNDEFADTSPQQTSIKGQSEVGARRKGILLPCAPRLLPEPSLDSIDDTLPSSSCHFLLVEDNPINLQVLKTCMKRLEHTFVTATNGLEAVAAFKASNEAPFDAIFMDISMPFLDGLGATRQIRNLERQTSDHVQIVALTGATSPSARADAFTSGVDLFLSKPVSMNTIREIVEQCKGGKKAVKI